MPNRMQRRKAKKYSIFDIQEAMAIAIAMRKLTKGHLFSKKLKDRCVFCGQTMKTKKECEYAVMTLFDRLQSVLVNPQFYTADNLQALWLQHGEEYQNIKLPMVVEVKEADGPTKT